MKRMTVRDIDGRANFITEIGTVYSAPELRLATVQVLLDRLSDYEDAEERGELVRLIAPNGCNFCRGVRFMAGNFEGSFPFDEYHDGVIQTDGEIDFYFCPMCGRPITSREEAKAALAEFTNVTIKGENNED